MFLFVHLFKINNFPDAPVTTKRFTSVASFSSATDRSDISSKDQTLDLVMVCSMWVATDVTAGVVDDKAADVECTVRSRSVNATLKSMAFKDILNKRQAKMFNFVHFVKCNAPVKVKPEKEIKTDQNRSKISNAMCTQQ